MTAYEPSGADGGRVNLPTGKTPAGGVRPAATSHGTHAYGDSYTGMLCGAMVALPDGSGDECGKPARHPIHGIDPIEGEQ